jgi:hypothetical protein
MVMRCTLVVLATTTGCFHPSFDRPRCSPNGECPTGLVCRAEICEAISDLPPIDAGVDAPTDAQDLCYGTGIVKICLDAAPTEAINIVDAKAIDTGDVNMCSATKSGAAGYCVIVGTTITIDNTVRGVGSKPLVFLASDSITSSATGIVDVGSYRLRLAGAPETGAGADPATCPAGTLPTTLGGGGAGGSFAGTGGAGAGGDGMNNGGTAGTAIVAFPDLRGGCAGQDGHAATPGDRGLRGHGGGAVYFIAGNKIELAGDVKAGGEAGGGGVANQAGGGGGGSGGMIGFDAPTITVTGSLIANGGSGAEGCSNGGARGIAGTDATTLAAATFALVNQASNSGGNGGNGSAVAAGGPGLPGLPGDGSGNEPGGGGGGGGGAGLIKAPATANLGTKVSPARTP